MDLLKQQPRGSPELTASQQKEIDGQRSGLGLWRGVVEKLHACCSAKRARRSIALNTRHTQLPFRYLDLPPKLRNCIYTICIANDAAAQDVKSKILEC